MRNRVRLRARNSARSDTAAKPRFMRGFTALVEGEPPSATAWQLPPQAGWSEDSKG